MINVVCLLFIHLSVFIYILVCLLGKFGKVIFCCAKILGYKTHPSYEQTLIKQAYFLVKNDASHG